jgi:hypothetical protein
MHIEVLRASAELYDGSQAEGHSLLIELLGFALHIAVYRRR